MEHQRVGKEVATVLGPMHRHFKIILCKPALLKNSILFLGYTRLTKLENLNQDP